MRKSYKKQFIAACGIIIVLLSGCESRDQIMDGDGMFQTYPYTKITQDEAKRMMEQDDDNVIVDVRRQDEYDEGHIPGTIGAYQCALLRALHIADCKRPYHRCLSKDRQGLPESQAKMYHDINWFRLSDEAMWESCLIYSKNRPPRKAGRDFIDLAVEQAKNIR